MLRFEAVRRLKVDKFRNIKHAFCQLEVFSMIVRQRPSGVQTGRFMKAYGALNWQMEG